MTKLDRSRPFGIVYGPTQYRYEQDGKMFDGAGNVIESVQQEAQEPGPKVEEPKTESVVKKESEVKPAIKKDETVAEKPEMTPLEKAKAGIDDEIPDFSIDLPLKYPAQMNSQDCIAELEENGVDWSTELEKLQKERSVMHTVPILRELVKNERERRGE